MQRCVVFFFIICVRCVVFFFIIICFCYKTTQTGKKNLWKVQNALYLEKLIIYYRPKNYFFFKLSFFQSTFFSPKLHCDAQIIHGSIFKQGKWTWQQEFVKQKEIWNNVYYEVFIITIDSTGGYKHWQYFFKVVDVYVAELLGI